MNRPSSTSASSGSPGTLLRRALLFGCCIAAMLTVLVVAGPSAAPSEYMRATVPKNERLRAIGSPKVVLIGGSNLSYGVDSKRLEEAFCKPVANMGLTALVGFRFAVDEVIGELGEDDVVIVSLENSMFTRPDRYEDALATVVDYRPAALALLPWYQRPRMIVALGVLHAQSLRDHVFESWRQGWRAPVYRKRVFNAQGDLVNQLEEPRMAIPPPDPDEFDALFAAEGFWPIAERLMTAAEARGAKVVFSWCPLAERVNLPEERAKLSATLMEHGLTVAGTPSDYVYADSLFYDSWYHLHLHGRRVRTERMVKDVCGALPGACCEAE